MSLRKLMIMFFVTVISIGGAPEITFTDIGRAEAKGARGDRRGERQGHRHRAADGTAEGSRRWQRWWRAPTLRCGGGTDTPEAAQIVADLQSPRRSRGEPAPKDRKGHTDPEAEGADL